MSEPLAMIARRAWPNLTNEQLAVIERLDAQAEVARRRGTEQTCPRCRGRGTVVAPTGQQADLTTKPQVSDHATSACPGVSLAAGQHARVRVLVIGREPNLDALAEHLNRYATDASSATLLHVEGDPASDTARTLWTGEGWTVEPVTTLPATPVLAAWTLTELHPDLVLLCQPVGVRHPLAASLRAAARTAGATVRDLPLRG